MLIINDLNKSVDVMLNASKWLEGRGKKSKWWDPANMHTAFVLKHAEPQEIFVAIDNGEPAASVILQETERNQSWKHIDRDTPQPALYVHWLCVNRKYAGHGLAGKMIEFAKDQAQQRGFPRLRLDTEADEPKLCHLYESMGFKQMGIEKGKDHQTAYYQMEIV